MVVAFAWTFGDSGWQTAQPDLAAQGIDDPQDIFEPHGGLARFKVDDEAHANPRCQGQLWLRQSELFAGRAKCVAELLS